MNRFRNKKKAKEEAAALARSSEDSEHASLSGFKGFRKGKKAPVEEPKKEFDLSTALPSDDNFRTSLLMTNLSARFSMLREQDDPNTKIGKASDDSVLYPKRQSRLADFGFGAAGGGLGDIAEVESIKASSHFLRSDSIASADWDNGGSILTRGKPIEGNNLFGGRQKIYKVPAAKSGGLGGRALYADDDVALSAFQRWRISEKEKEQQEHETEEGHEQDEEHEDHQRSESPPPVGYNRKRETSSTTSSASIMVRNSTAANSITSQPAGYVSTAPTSAASTPILDRSVTHKRRLYEQNTSQDGPEQSSVLSRIESLNRQRTAASGVKALGDRLGQERTLASKTSAPQLRSVSPPITTPATGTGDLGNGAAPQADPKLNFGGSPPLSPPISETGEPHPLLPIQPNDVGKATAMGVFQKPLQPYDETKYAQRQLQLQQGRETPTPRFRAESDASFATARSRESSTHRQPCEARGEPLRTQPALEEEPASTDLDSQAPESLQAQALAALSGQLSLQRPADEEHPALRGAAAPPPLSINTSAKQNPTISIEESVEPASADSPTLGPSAGLGGLVRSHLRSDSNASSIWGVSTQNSGAEPRSLDMLPEPKITPWIAPEQEWTLAYYGNGAKPSTDNQASEALQKETPAADPAPSNRSSSATDHGLSKPSNRSSNTDSELDEFASQLAEARRRVRERLTSYAESDSSRATSPVRQPEVPSHKGSQSSLNPLGISVLKAKSSTSSLVDRSRNTSGSQSKSLKLLGLGGTMSSSRSPTKDSFDERETAVQAIPERSKARQIRHSSETENDSSSQSANDKEETSSAHPGLMAFRNAKRELQKRKELEALAQQQLSTTAQSPDESSNMEPLAFQSPPPRAPGRGRTPSREGRIHPMQYSSRGPSPERGYGMHRNSPPTHIMPGSRERSDSEANRGRSTSQSRRLHHHMLQQDGQLAPGTPRGPMRSPGLHGTGIKQSPIMPPQGHHPHRGAPSTMPSPHSLDRSKSAGNLKAGRAGYGAYPGQPSPASPMLPSPYTSGSPAGTPTFGPRSRQPAASQPPSETAKRFVDKREISEPTFVMATSRMPTMDLPHGYSQEGGSRPSSHAGVPPVPTTAPPVPPINPRRRRETSRDSPDGAGMGMPRPPFANQTDSMVGSDADTQSAFSVSDDEEAGKSDHRRRLRKPHIESTGRVGRALANMRENGSTFSLNKSSHSTNSPSGMF
ncbi:hypothetical protein QBC32DRAFT_18938 [Pseudoneurospora amorphoporcata]|uniref:Uncharacterized protein n=1 Tax=Pseudoneurospora amorphoporcata TaxID=241081 RepID=A0AAN6NQL4_9PEZI|nr:hypothetical protein QBC32DRAFT_18938 [Pseudoneurospora amorphoporcata]